MTVGEVKDLVEATFEELVAKYPTLPRPGLVFIPDMTWLGSPAGYNQELNLIAVAPSALAHPASSPEAVRFVVAHEIGHWHQWRTGQIPLEKVGIALAEFDIKQMFGMFKSQRDVNIAYRKMPHEAYADQFANQYLGVSFDVLSFQEQVLTA